MFAFWMWWELCRPFFIHISDVICRCAEKHMCRITAFSVVANMAHIHPVGDRAIDQFPGIAMGIYVDSTNVEMSVTVSETSQPFKATCFGRNFVDLSIESFGIGRFDVWCVCVGSVLYRPSFIISRTLSARVPRSKWSTLQHNRLWQTCRITIPAGIGPLTSIQAKRWASCVLFISCTKGAVAKSIAASRPFETTIWGWHCGNFRPESFDQFWCILNYSRHRTSYVLCLRRK